MDAAVALQRVGLRTRSLAAAAAGEAALRPLADPSASAMPARYPSDAGSGPRPIVATSPRANKSLLTPLDLPGCVREGPLSDTNSETPHNLGWVSEIWFALAAIRTPFVTLANAWVFRRQTGEGYVQFRLAL